MTKYSQLDTAALIAHFVDGATRLGTVFNLPLKMDRKSPQEEMLFREMQLLGDELSARKPIADIRPLYDDPNEDVRYWAALQFMLIDPEWAGAVSGAVREHLTTGEVVSLVRRAMEPSVDKAILSDMSIAELAQRFEDASMRLYATEFMSDESGLPDTKAYNRIKGEIFDISSELEERHALESLFPMLQHPNRFARHMAAMVCLPIAPDLAVPVLESVAQNNNPPREGMYAWWTLNQWRKKQAASSE